MVKQVSMADIARHLNISRATVSYVLNERESELISEGTRARVLEAARSMGYRRNRAAQALAGHCSHIIELCVHGFHPSYYGQVLEAFRQEFRPSSYELHIVDLEAIHWAESKGVWPVDGIIADSLLSDEMLSFLIQRGTPVVSVGPYANRDVDHVFVDLFPALLEGIRHLTAHSRRVAFVSLWSLDLAATAYKGDPRYRAYHQVMQEAGLAEEVIVAHESSGTSLRASTRQVVHQHITQHGSPDAFICFNDERAIGTLMALRDLGLHVPTDVLLLGCDGIEETEYHRPTISTIQYPFEEVARLSWEFLQQRIKHPETPLQSAVLTTQLVLRESSSRNFQLSS